LFNAWDTKGGMGGRVCRSSHRGNRSGKPGFNLKNAVLKIIGCKSNKASPSFILLYLMHLVVTRLETK